jgi:thioredoxin-related protein
MVCKLLRIETVIAIAALAALSTFTSCSTEERESVGATVVSNAPEMVDESLSEHGAVEASEWLTDFAAAKALAKEKGVPLLVNFSGSDWCGWCKRLAKEVLSQVEFQNFAKEHLVLVVADFPRSTPQSDAIKQQNEKLASQYSVRGFPTVLLLDAEGKELARTGYKDGGAEAYVTHLKQLMGSAE